MMLGEKAAKLADVERTVMGPGSVFHNWVLQRELARGGMGVVYFAEHKHIGRSAAVKVIAPPPGMVAEQKAIERFRREVEMHVSLRLPNLPDFYDADLFPDGTAVLVLEYLDGKDLARALHSLGRIPVGDALFVATEILRPLEVIHRTSVHRDVKPPNIFVRRRPRFDSEGHIDKNRVTLLDFGIAKMKLKPGVTHEHTIVGTKCYMSPEQLRGESIDGRSDLYSVAIVLYEMLFGHPPFIPDLDRVPHFNVVMLDHLTNPFPDLRRTSTAWVPDDVWNFILALSEKKASERPDSAKVALEMAKALRTKYQASSRLFRKDIQDVVTAMEELAAESTLPPVTPPTATERSGPIAFLSTEEDAAGTPANENQLSAWPEVTLPTASPEGGQRGGDPGASMAPEMARETSGAADRAVEAQAGAHTVPGARVPTRASLIRERRAALPAPGKPTARMSESPEVQAWEDELANQLQKKLRAPRVFRRPGLVMLSDELLPAAIYELRKPINGLGTDPGLEVSLPGAQIAGRHLVLKHGATRRLTLELERAALPFRDAMVLDERREVMDQATHGSFLRCGDRVFRIEDLVAADPSGELLRIRKRSRRAILRGHWSPPDGARSDGARSDGEVLGPVLVAETEIRSTLTLIGSARACQLQLDDGPGFAAAVWLRADGELEATLLDESKLPFGDPIVKSWLLTDGETVPLFGAYTLTVDDPPSHSTIQRGVPSPRWAPPPPPTPSAASASPNPSAAAPAPSVPTAPAARQPAPTAQPAPTPNPAGSPPSNARSSPAAPSVDITLKPDAEELRGHLLVAFSGAPDRPCLVVLPDDAVFPIGSAPAAEGGRSMSLRHLMPQHLLLEQIPGDRLRIRAATGATFDLGGQLVNAAEIPDGGTFRLPRVATFTYKAPKPPPSRLRRFLRRFGL
jgi:serine/threonine-protein kinase